MFSIRKFVVYSTLLMIFSDRFYITVGVNIFAYYFIVLLNLTLLALVDSLWLPPGVLLFLGALLLSAVMGMVRGTDSLAGFLKDYCGIVPNLLYACAFLRFLKFDVEKFFAMYATTAFYLAVLGILLLPLNISAGTRLTSIVAEPSGFCLACVPALYYYADSWQRKREYGWRFLVLLAACILTLSSVGFMGMLFALYLFGTRYRFGTFLAPAVIVLVGAGIYMESTMFQVRMDDTVNALVQTNAQGINLSSFGVVVGIFVTEKAFAAHPIVGGGLGSYVVSFDHFAHQLPGMDQFELIGYGQLGRWDASSFLLRISAEFGLVGLALAAWFLWNFFPRRSTASRRAIAMALLTYLFMKALRAGQYFNPEEMLFFATYAVNGMLAKQERGKSVALPRNPEVNLPRLSSPSLPTHVTG